MSCLDKERSTIKQGKQSIITAEKSVEATDSSEMGGKIVRKNRRVSTKKISYLKKIAGNYYAEKFVSDANSAA